MNNIKNRGRHHFPTAQKPGRHPYPQESHGGLGNEKHTISRADPFSADKILEGSVKIADYEQNFVIVETYSQMELIADGYFVKAMSSLAENPVPGGDHFRQVVGMESLISNSEKRWQWVTAGLPGFPDQNSKGVLQAWKNLSILMQVVGVDEDLRINARRFSAPWILTHIEIPALPDADIQVWDHLDQPGEQ